jgi:hypothetical protein
VRRIVGLVLTTMEDPTSGRTATPAINHGKQWHTAALSEFGMRFLNGIQRSVNRKVQGSNPWSGANVMSQV